MSETRQASTKLRVFEPKELPELRQTLVDWTRRTAPWFWRETHMRGSKFYLPPDLRHLPIPQAIEKLANRYADTLDKATLYSVTPEMTFLAAKTAMPKFLLSLDMPPVPKGFIVWQMPIGAAEHTQRMQIEVDRATGDVTSASLHEWLEGIKDEDVPVVAASWELSDDQSQVMVVWYTQPEDVYLKGLSPNQAVEARTIIAPLAFEREQILPVGQQLDWFTSDDEPRLELTVKVELDKVPASMREEAIKRNNDVLPSLDQMTKTLLASWMLMRMRFAKTQVELPDRAARKRLLRAGASEEQARAGVQVIKMGGPLRQQKPKDSEPAFRWKKRRIVGPFVRNQWYPSTAEHKPKLVEPYIAGPEGAPIGNAEKVYLLG